MHHLVTLPEGSFTCCRFRIDLGGTALSVLFASFVWTACLADGARDARASVAGASDQRAQHAEPGHRAEE